MPPRGGAGVAWMRGRGPGGHPWGMEGPTLHEARRAATRAPTPPHAAPAPPRCLSPWQKPTLERYQPSRRHFSRIRSNSPVKAVSIDSSFLDEGVAVELLHGSFVKDRTPYCSTSVRERIATSDTGSASLRILLAHSRYPAILAVNEGETGKNHSPATSSSRICSHKWCQLR